MSSKRPSRTVRRLLRVVVLLFIFCLLSSSPSLRKLLIVKNSLRANSLYLSGEQSVPHENAQASDGAARGREEGESFISFPLSGLLASENIRYLLALRRRGSFARSFRAKRPQRRRAWRNGCFRRLGSTYAYRFVASLILSRPSICFYSLFRLTSARLVYFSDSFRTGLARGR